jgi:hypothetical protein
MMNSMRPAGGAVNLDPNSRKPTVDDGKNRLFGLYDENSVPHGQQQMGQSKNTGKKILQPGNSANTYTNVIGGSYEPEVGYGQQVVNSKAAAKYMSGPGMGVNPITSHNVDQYYPEMMGNNRPY